MVELEFQNYEENVKTFNKIKDNLLKSISRPIIVDHVGSTAIKNMFGKNIIDILVGVQNHEDFEIVYKELTNLEFYPSKNFESNIYHFFASTDAETKSGDIHIHLAIIGTDRYQDFLTLKYYLINNPDEAKAYSDHKLELIKKGTTERSNYRKEKSKYVSNLILKARQNRN